MLCLDKQRMGAFLDAFAGKVMEVSDEIPMLHRVPDSRTGGLKLCPFYTMPVMPGVQALTSWMPALFSRA